MAIRLLEGTWTGKRMAGQCVVRGFLDVLGDMVGQTPRIKVFQWVGLQTSEV